MKPKLKAQNSSTPSIIEEGFRQRRNEVTGWMCVACWHHMTVLSLDGSCSHCKRIGNLHPVKTRARLQAETDMALDKQRWKPNQKEFNPFDPMSQMGKPLTHQQLLKVLQKFISGTVMKPHIHPLMKRKLMAIYIPDRSNQIVRESFSPYEIKHGLRFVCNCEFGLMPEWDIMRKDEKGLPLTQVRGWRSVVGAMYRSKLIPFVPDDGNRKSNFEIRESQFKENRF